jgi:hypothetical protein
MRFYGDIVAAGPILALMPSAPDRTVFSVRRWLCCAIPARPALLIHVPTAGCCSQADPSTELHRLREPRACPVTKRRNAKSITAAHRGKSRSPETCAAHHLLTFVKSPKDFAEPRTDPLTPSIVWNVSTHVDGCLENR